MSAAQSDAHMSVEHGDEEAERLLEADQTQTGHHDHNIHTAADHYRTGAGTHLSDLEHSRLRRLLYTSPLLSTWNSRAFEFGAFLFLANIFPRTLLPASIYALARAAPAALLSPCLGSYMDSADRLRVVRLSIGKPFAHARHRSSAISDFVFQLASE